MKKWRVSSFLGANGASTVRAILIFEVIVAAGGLAIGTTTEFPARASQSALSEAMPGALAGLPGKAMQDGTVPNLQRLTLSAAEFGAALRAGDVKFGTWDPEAKAFVVELTEADAARLQLRHAQMGGTGG